MKTKKERVRFSSAELAEALVYPVRLTPEEKKAADKQLKAARSKVQSETSPAEKLKTNLLYLRFKLEDYLESEVFDPGMRFSFFLKEYIQLQNKKRKEFATEIGIDETELSQLINNHRSPGDSIIIRLEIHSKKTIPAIAWFKLVEREKEHYIATDKAIRKQEAKKVFNKLSVNIVQ
ncbi:helix-turn-helix domain-containing protein [Flavihumibacter petaseus]|uniref:Putative DNA-binding protein n=1 Tax=Flavihumibacter petaseus NBRC 106054 TaxID=1220578 RepID=A0A0E9N679_9BACT|nr:helix-turn-helix transcriptional regulator [Flavihumibacter petaseus]GAO45432.1 putative DNA-binding protein [Flavihumibacter petaseus NBRC 106054]